MKNKSGIVTIIISILVIITLVAAGSYAYFAGEVNTENLLVNITVEGFDANFKATGNSNVTLNVSGSKMLNASAGTVAGQTTTSMNVTLTTKQNVTCTYDVIWVWNSKDSYKLSSGATKEFTIAGTGGGTISETQLANASSSTNLGSFSVTANNTTTSKNWTFTLKFYNLSVVQDSHADKSYSGKVTVDNIDCYVNN